LTGVVSLDCRLAGGSWQTYRMEVIDLGRPWWLEVGSTHVEFSTMAVVASACDAPGRLGKALLPCGAGLRLSAGARSVLAERSRWGL